MKLASVILGCFVGRSADEGSFDARLAALTARARPASRRCRETLPRLFRSATA